MSSSSILLTPVRKEPTTLILSSPPPPPSPTTKLVHFPSLPNLVDQSDEDYHADNNNGRPIGFFLVAPATVNTAAAIPTRRTDVKRRVPVSPPSSPRWTLHPRPLKKLKTFSWVGSSIRWQSDVNSNRICIKLNHGKSYGYIFFFLTSFIHLNDVDAVVDTLESLNETYYTSGLHHDFFCDALPSYSCSARGAMSYADIHYTAHMTAT